MTLHFHLHYYTQPGQTLVICGNTPETGNGNEAQAPAMRHTGDGHWVLDLTQAVSETLTYRYLVRDAGGIVRREWGQPRRLDIAVDVEDCRIHDYWQPEPETPLMGSSAFSDSLLAIPDAQQAISYEGGRLVIKVFAPLVRRQMQLGLSGDTNLLGNWDPLRAIPLLPGDYPEWRVSLETATLPPVCHYKFVLIDRATQEVVAWEWGEPRELRISSSRPQALQIEAGLYYRYQEAPWKGAGTAVPLFSLRSTSSWGCGDFKDLRQLVDWMVNTGQQLIQLLPINDTTLTGSWEDSYPYNAISVHALHPLYLAPADLPQLIDAAQQAAFETERCRLEALPNLDYEAAWQLKRAFIEAFFRQEKQALLASTDYLDFVETNRDWLDPYAAFCYLRDSQPRFDSTTWGVYSQGKPAVTKDLCSPHQPWHDSICQHRVVQYLLHVQLKAARDYAHSKGVILKGDIPIGVNRYGVDVWQQPDLFDKKVQVGAPPDTFSTTGQNWGFPSYNWERMAEDGYRWWKRRFTHLALYMDAFRIDHILGFFRIWEIPEQAVRGLLGQFNPALPYTVKELEAIGIDDSLELSKPQIEASTLESLFGELTAEVMPYLKEGKKGVYTLKKACDTQQKIQALLAKKPTNARLLEGLYRLCEEVLFLPDRNNSERLHPRINGMDSDRFKTRSIEQQTAYRALHDDFFYHRHADFWKDKALEKLPPLLQATRMLACGEDLGMIPATVPTVMNQLQLLSLEIQRMPKHLGMRFENLNAIPYLSVCTTSTHDLAPLRVWWKEDREVTDHYYKQILWKPGATPNECTPEISRDIIELHLASPAMWVILPWQDWMAMDARLRRSNPDEERINIPSNPRHYWKYRMHLSLEQLISCEPLALTIRSLIQRSGR